MAKIRTEPEFKGQRFLLGESHRVDLPGLSFSTRVIHPAIVPTVAGVIALMEAMFPELPLDAVRAGGVMSGGFADELARADHQETKWYALELLALAAGERGNEEGRRAATSRAIHMVLVAAGNNE